MRQALRSPTLRQPVGARLTARVETFPPPVGGWNQRDTLPLMEPTDAITLENWIPDTNSVRMRTGYTTHSTLLVEGNDSFTKILLNMDGTDAGTVFTDSNTGGSAHAFTAVGNAQTDTALSKFGGSSGLFDGTGDWITTPDHADFDVGSGDFTIECWFNRSGGNGTARWLGGHGAVASDTTCAYSLLLGTGNNLLGEAFVGVGFHQVAGTTTFTTAGWHHVAFVRTGNTLKLFVDGIQEGGDVAISGAINASPSVFGVGVQGDRASNSWFGSIDEFRLSVGVARWTTAFTPPLGPYSTSALPPVETLVEYRSPSTTKLFAATPTIIYDVTTTGAGLPVVTSRTNGRWQDATMVNTAGTFLILVNGQDAPLTYDGTTWGTASISASGLTNTNLIGVKNHMNRLWFIEENQLHVWYGATSAIAGTLTKFLPPFRKGGKLMAMANWTRDGGAGPDDFAVFISSKGECVIYAGTDPSSATTSALVGVYEIPDVIGRRCTIKAGADLGILTMQGLVPLSSILGMSEGAAGRTSFTDKISGYFRRQFFTTGTSFGWQPVEYPRGNLLIVNIPIAERVTQVQAVLNINTGSWCKFTNINAGCWATRNNDIYFGGNSAVVYKWDSGSLDGTALITATLQHAYGTLGSPQTKRFNQARPLFLSPPNLRPPVTIQVDYDEAPPVITIVTSPSSGTQWDVGQWDTFQWAGGTVPSLAWQTVAGLGRAGTIAFGVASGETLIYNGSDVMIERGHWM